MGGVDAELVGTSSVGIKKDVYTTIHSDGYDFIFGQCCLTLYVINLLTRSFVIVWAER